MRILVVEDSERLRRTLKSALVRSGYAVDEAADGEEGLWLARENRYDALVLDVMLPLRDGLSVLAELRKAGIETHVLLLTARDTVADRVQGLRAGADDYLVKPFALEELLARIGASVRRTYGTKNTRLHIGDLEIDTLARTARRTGGPIDLTAREYSLLEYMARRKGEVVTRTEIEETLYAGEVELMSNAVDSAICSLRRKLGAGGAPPLVHTRRGLGYTLDLRPTAGSGRA